MALTKLKELCSTQSAKISGVVGTGIHLYSTALNNEHFQNIVEDFANERYTAGVLKAVVPYALPYAVSLYVRKKAIKEAQGKISELRGKISDLEQRLEDKE